MRKYWLFSAWSPLKGHTCLNKPVWCLLTGCSCISKLTVYLSMYNVLLGTRHIMTNKKKCRGRRFRRVLNALKIWKAFKRLHAVEWSCHKFMYTSHSFMKFLYYLFAKTLLMTAQKLSKWKWISENEISGGNCRNKRYLSVDNLLVPLQDSEGRTTPPSQNFFHLKHYLTH